jgi:hypothetical protein
VSRFSRPAWLTTGLIIGVIAVPAVSVAATATYVSITANGRVAGVTPYGQLRSAEADPGYAVHKAAFVTPGCTDLGVLSKNVPLVLKQFNVGMTSVDSAVTHGEIYLRTGSECGGVDLAKQDHSTFDTIPASLDPGLMIPAGAHLSVFVKFAVFDVDLYGYQAVSAAKPPASPAQMLRNAGPAAQVKER